MKTLINKSNPALRITAEVEILYDKYRCVKYYYVKDLRLGLLRENWALVEEEPEKVNCPFDKGNCRYCTVQFCGAREENHIETRSTAEPVDLEKVAEEYADKHGFRVPYDGSNNLYDDVDVKASLEGFKEGAKWMAEQGITFKDKVMPTTDNKGNVDGYCLDGENEFAVVKAAVENDYLKVGDKVIVQIRKAE